MNNFVYINNIFLSFQWNLGAQEVDICAEKIKQCNWHKMASYREQLYFQHYIWALMHTGVCYSYFYIYIYIFFFFFFFLAVLDLPCYVQAFSSCSKQGLLFVGVLRLLIAVTSLVAEHRLQAHRLFDCGVRLSCSMAYGIFLEQR